MTPLSLSKPESNGNEGVLPIPYIFRNGASLSNCFGINSGYSRVRVSLLCRDAIGVFYSSSQLRYANFRLCLNDGIYKYIYIYIYIRGAYDRFPDFFVWAFKIVDSWKFSILMLYILWDDWPIFMISGSNEQLQQQLEYSLLKPDCHSWWISKIQSGREDTLEERYAIRFCFKLGKNATEMYGML